MKFSTIFLSLLGCLALYYIGMYVYDVYLDTITKGAKKKGAEQEIDISGIAEGMESREIDRDQVAEPRKKNKLDVPLPVMQLVRLFEMDASGEGNGELDEIIRGCSGADLMPA